MWIIYEFYTRIVNKKFSARRHKVRIDWHEFTLTGERLTTRSLAPARVRRPRVDAATHAAAAAAVFAADDAAALALAALLVVVVCAPLLLLLLWW